MRLPPFSLLDLLPAAWVKWLRSHKNACYLLGKSFLVVAAAYSIWFDIQMASPRPMDLRNRIIGARMLKDGASPYFYIWKPGEPTRYYDVKIPPNAVVSRSTATPFFHWIMRPVADWPQYQLNLLWLLLQYGLLLAAVLLVIAWQKPPPLTQWCIAAAAVAFTFTIGWRDHVFAGQNYLFIPALALGAWAALQQSEKSWTYALLFALLAVALVLIRLPALLLLAPLILYLPKYRLAFSLAALCMGMYVLYVLVHPVKRLNWQEYFAAVKVHTSLHQLVRQPPAVEYDPMPIRQFEGISLDFPQSEQSAQWLERRKYNGNFFNLWYSLTHQRPSVATQNTLGLLFYAWLIGLFGIYFYKKRQWPSLAEICLLGFCGYAVYEYFTPVTRFIYGFCQWLLPWLLIWCLRPAKVAQWFALAGMALHILRIPIWGQGHLLGQTLLLAAFALVVSDAKVRANVSLQPSNTGMRGSLG